MNEQDTNQTTAPAGFPAVEFTTCQCGSMQAQVLSCEGRVMSVTCPRCNRLIPYKQASHI